MSHYAMRILVFSILFAFFLIAPAILTPIPFSSYPLMTWGDVVDILTPLVLVPFYWLLFRCSQTDLPGEIENLLFLVVASLWVLGQGMHLGANAIGHHAGELIGSDLYTLTYLLDEILSHYLWHAGIIGMTILLIWREWRAPFPEIQPAAGILLLAGIIHGVTLFLIVIEGNTASMVLPFSLILTLFGLLWGRGSLRYRPELTFFTIAYGLCLVIALLWWLYWGGLTPPSELGLIS